MLSKILFLYHGGTPVPVATTSSVSGGLSGTGQIFIVLVFLGLLGLFFWHINKK